jgi:hypothetical protein
MPIGKTGLPSETKGPVPIEKIIANCELQIANLRFAICNRLVLCKSDHFPLCRNGPANVLIRSSSKGSHDLLARFSETGEQNQGYSLLASIGTAFAFARSQNGFIGGMESLETVPNRFAK